MRWERPEFAEVEVTLELLFDARCIFAEMMVEDSSGMLTLRKLGNWILKHGPWDVTSTELQTMLRQVLLITCSAAGRFSVHRISSLLTMSPFFVLHKNSLPVVDPPRQYDLLD